jgi:hypothetical protein
VLPRLVDGDPRPRKLRIGEGPQRHRDQLGLVLGLVVDGRPTVRAKVKGDRVAALGDPAVGGARTRDLDVGLAEPRLCPEDAAGAALALRQWQTEIRRLRITTPSCRGCTRLPTVMVGRPLLSRLNSGYCISRRRGASRPGRGEALAGFRSPLPRTWHDAVRRAQTEQRHQGPPSLTCSEEAIAGFPAARAPPCRSRH